MLLGVEGEKVVGEERSLDCFAEARGWIYRRLLVGRCELSSGLVRKLTGVRLRKVRVAS